MEKYLGDWSFKLCLVRPVRAASTFSFYAGAFFAPVGTTLSGQAEDIVTSEISFTMNGKPQRIRQKANDDEEK